MSDRDYYRDKCVRLQERVEAAERERDEAKDQTAASKTMWHDAEVERRAAEERVSAASEFLDRLAEWDMLFIPSHGEVVGQVADAAYWKAEIEKARAALRGNQTGAENA